AQLALRSRIAEGRPSGDRVAVLSRTAHWVRIQLRDGRIGWVDAKVLLDAATEQRAELLLKGLEAFGPQADGHLTSATSVRLEPSREAIQLMELPEKQRVEFSAGSSWLERRRPKAARGAFPRPNLPGTLGTWCALTRKQDGYWDAWSLSTYRRRSRST